MEDQSADSGDLTTTTPEEAATASVPQGKAARSRHRLPRQKAGQLPETEDDVAEEGVAAEEGSTEVVETEPDEPAVVVEPEPAVEPVPTRRKLPWRRAKTPVVPPAPAPDVDEAAAGDDVVEGPAVDSDAAAEPPVIEQDVIGQDVAGQDEADGDETTAAEPEPDAVLVPHRPAGPLLKATAVAAGVLFIAAGAFAGASLQPYLADRAAVHEKFEIAETAASAITTLWTYTPEDMDQLPERSAKFLGGDFASEYRSYIDGIAETNKQAQVTNNTQVLGAAVESLGPTDATALVYTNSVATSPLTKGIPSLRYISYRLSMVRAGSRWLVTQMVAVTKLDLTPRI